MIYKDFSLGRFYNADCFDAMKEMPDNCVDMILCDLPYGTTGNKWDTVIPFEPLWVEYLRLCKPEAMIVLTAAQPFSSAVVMSNPAAFKHEWVWVKNKVTGHLNAKRKPMRQHEDVLVFGGKLYNPQELKPYNKITKRTKNGTNFGESGLENFQEFTNYPKTLIEFASDLKPVHPTQKPVALFEYLIKTYSNENDLILDNCAGSGTTAVACTNLNRRWVCIEQEEKYYLGALGRL